MQSCRCKVADALYEIPPNQCPLTWWTKMRQNLSGSETISGHPVLFYVHRADIFVLSEFYLIAVSTYLHVLVQKGMMIYMGRDKDFQGTPYYKDLRGHYIHWPCARPSRSWRRSCGKIQLVNSLIFLLSSTMNSKEKRCCARWFRR